MTEKVTSLINRQGFPPKLKATGDYLCEQVWGALDDARQSGLPVAMIIGFLEMAKHDLLASLAGADDGDQA